MISPRFAAASGIVSLALVVACLLALGLPAGAATATIEVNTFQQVNDEQCTLADAIDSANANADFGGCMHTGTCGADTIILPTGVYSLTASKNDGNDGLGSNGLSIVTSDITILGNGLRRDGGAR
jgi:hypothetical protein